MHKGKVHIQHLSGLAPYAQDALSARSRPALRAEEDAPTRRSATKVSATPTVYRLLRPSGFRDLGVYQRCSPFAAGR